MTAVQASGAKAVRQKIWWSNAVFFVGVHVATVIGAYYRPPWLVKPATLVFAFLVWQLADFGITIGYHRLYSHKAFRASIGVRIVLALLGAVAFQGSIKWWCLRHRLHHRYTDDPIHDPYAATRGFFYSHMGWIFFKPNYERMGLIERDDLERDPVVRFQHKNYVLLALTLGFGMPPLIGFFWGDALGAFVWAGLVARLFIWHCTFLVNSFAHMHGLQPYSDEDTSRGNLVRASSSGPRDNQRLKCSKLLALLTGGEGNHNFHHSFPHDFRSGPSNLDWDPSKWIIIGLHHLGWVSGLRKAREIDVTDSLEHMKKKTLHPGVALEEEDSEWQGEVWNDAEVFTFQEKNPSRCLLLLGGYVVDVTRYLGEHPGGAAHLRTHSIRKQGDINSTGAQWAFYGGFNNHSRAAKKRMREMRIAKLIEPGVNNAI